MINIIIIIVIAIWAGLSSTSQAFQGDCLGGKWVLIEDISDLWAIPPDSSYPTSGTGPFGFWEEPTSCTDVVYDGENKLEYSKRLVCVNQPPLEKIREAPVGGNCQITGRAVPDPWFKNPDMSPCADIKHIPPYPGSHYGNVTTANRMKKYQCDLCPDDINKIEPGQCGCGIQDIDTNSNGIADCKEPNNLGPPQCPVLHLLLESNPPLNIFEEK